MKTTIQTLVLAALLAWLPACDRDAPAEHPGKRTYERYCFSCHAAGVAGAPEFGDPEAWAPRLAKGEDAMLRSVIDGMPPGMPVMGLCMACSEEQLRDSIDYIVQALPEESVPGGVPQ